LFIELIGKQQHLLGKLEGLGFDIREKTVLESEIKDILTNSQIEGNLLQESQIRSSIAKNLGIEMDEPTNKSIETEGAIHLFLDATRNYKSTLTPERLFDWHAGLFPTGRSSGIKIEVAAYRSSNEPMQIVSGAMGREPFDKLRNHYEAPHSSKVSEMMDELLRYINTNEQHPFIKASIAHLWFEVIHPFEDGNGRIGRAIVD
jgi:Fic family protein